MPADDALRHATAIASAGHGVLITGPSGSGKSDLALRMIAWPPAGFSIEPFALVSDDQVLLRRDGTRLLAAAPHTIAGRLEVRGLGIVALDYVAKAHIRLVVELSPAEAIERMPGPESVTLQGVLVPLIRLFPHEASAPVKVALALRGVVATGHLP